MLIIDKITISKFNNINYIATNIILIASLSVLLLFTGCVLAKPESNKTWVSTDSSQTSDHWFKANQECQYDANKYSSVTQTEDNAGATSATSYTDNSRLVDLYYQCMYSKGGWHEVDREVYLNSKKALVSELDQAVILSNNGKYNEAISKLNEYIKKDTNNCFAYALRGIAYNGKKQFDMAMLNYNDAIRMCDQEPDFYQYRSITYALMKQYNNAITDANKSIYMEPEKAEYYKSRSEIYSMTKGYTKAVDDLTQAISLSKNNNTDKYYLERGKIFMKIGNKVNGKNDFDMACKIGNKAACEIMAKTELPEVKNKVAGSEEKAKSSVPAKKKKKTAAPAKESK